LKQTEREKDGRKAERREELGGRYRSSRYVRRTVSYKMICKEGYGMIANII